MERSSGPRRPCANCPMRGSSWNFAVRKSCNETHESKTDADALLARKGKGKESKLSYNGSLLVDNREGLIVNAELLQANGRAERDAALLMLEQVPGDGRITVGGDKGFDTAAFVDECRQMNVTPHVAQNTSRPRRQRHRCAHHTARRLCRQSEEEKAHRGVLRLAEGDPAAAEN